MTKFKEGDSVAIAEVTEWDTNHGLSLHEVGVVLEVGQTGATVEFHGKSHIMYFGQLRHVEAEKPKFKEGDLIEVSTIGACSGCRGICMRVVDGDVCFTVESRPNNGCSRNKCTIDYRRVRHLEPEKPKFKEGDLIEVCGLGECIGCQGTVLEITARGSVKMQVVNPVVPNCSVNSSCYCSPENVVKLPPLKKEESEPISNPKAPGQPVTRETVKEGDWVKGINSGELYHLVRMRGDGFDTKGINGGANGHCSIMENYVYAEPPSARIDPKAPGQPVTMETVVVGDWVKGNITGKIKRVTKILPGTDLVSSRIVSDLHDGNGQARDIPSDLTYVEPPKEETKEKEVPEKKEASVVAEANSSVQRVTKIKGYFLDDVPFESPTPDPKEGWREVSRAGFVDANCFYNKSRIVFCPMPGEEIHIKFHFWDNIYVRCWFEEMQRLLVGRVNYITEVKQYERPFDEQKVERYPNTYA